LVIVICLVIVSWLLGFGLGGCGNPIRQFNPNAPVINSVSPKDGSTGVYIYPVITATFSKNMDASTINASTFALSSPEGGVAGTVSYDTASKTASFTSSGKLSFLTKYTAIISDQVKDSSGSKLSVPYSFSFTTGGFSEAAGITDESFSDGTHSGYGTYYEVSKILNLSVQQPSHGESMILDPYGKILVAGKSRYQLNNSSHFFDNMTVWRINTDGSLDQTFGDGGAAHDTTASIEGEESIGRSIAVDANGKILVAGELYAQSGIVLIIWRYNSDGTADKNFGAGGKVVYPDAVNGNSIALDPSGDIVVMATLSIEGFSILRFEPDGTFDGMLPATPEGVVFRTENTAVDSLGKVLVTGSKSSAQYGSSSDMATWRYDLDETLDESFGANGMVSFPAGGDDEDVSGKSVLTDSLGRVVVMGITYPGGGGSLFTTAGTAMTIWRYK